MRIVQTSIFFLALTFYCLPVLSQQPSNAGWLFISHSQQLSKKFVGLADVQLRSSDKLEHIQTLLLRAGIGYKLNKGHLLAVGYTYKGDWTTEAGTSSYSPENRIYEQYSYNTHIKLTEVTFRFRQEQRFVKENTAYMFSQRSRVFLSFQIPLAVNSDFSKGVYS